MSMNTAIAPQTNTRRALATELSWLDFLVYANPAANIAPATLAILAAEFAGEDAGIMRAAARAHVHSSRWFPGVRELRAHVTDARQQAEVAEAPANARAQASRLRDLRLLRAEALEDAYNGVSGAIARLWQLAREFEEQGQEYAARSLKEKAARIDAMRLPR